MQVGAYSGKMIGRKAQDPVGVGLMQNLHRLRIDEDGTFGNLRERKKGERYAMDDRSLLVPLSIALLAIILSVLFSLSLHNM